MIPFSLMRTGRRLPVIDNEDNVFFSEQNKSLIAAGNNYEQKQFNTQV